MMRDQGRPSEAGGVLVLRGLVCPMPVLRLKKALQGLEPGAVAAVLTDDPHAPSDIRTFSAQSGHQVLSQETTPEGAVISRVRRRG